MEIKHKLYPYPVLSYYSDDYFDSSFDVVIDSANIGFNLKLDFLAELKNIGLEKLLDSGKAKIVYHLECAQTGYRVVFNTSHFENSFMIDNKMINGKLQICPFIVASEDISDYVNDNFHKDYRGFKFSIEKGCVMAVGRQLSIFIEKDINDLANTSSILSIIKHNDEFETGMIVDLDHKKILIKIPEKDFINLKNLKGEIIVQPLLNSLIIIPTLIYVLEEISKREPEDRYEYSTYAWYRTIKKSLATNFDCDIEDAKFSNKNMLVLAQNLINSPLSNALQVLVNGYSYIEEDEE